MKNRFLFVILLVLLHFVFSSGAFSAGQKTGKISLIKGEVVELGLSGRYATAVQFPYPVEGVMGFGLTGGEEPGAVQYSVSQDRQFLMLRQVMPNQEVFMTVVIRGDMYHFHLYPEPQALIGVELIDSSESLPRASEITVDDVAQRRVTASSETLYYLLKITREYEAYARFLPQIYQNSQRRQIESTYDLGEIVTRIYTVHRYPQHDAIVLLGEIENRTDSEIFYEPQGLKVRVGGREYPVLFSQVGEKIEPENKLRAHIVIQGDGFGGRANLSVKNNFTLLMPEWSMEPIHEEMHADNSTVGRRNG